jgi:hypothetical protein
MGCAHRLQPNPDFRRKRSHTAARQIDVKFNIFDSCRECTIAGAENAVHEVDAFIVVV